MWNKMVMALSACVCLAGSVDSVTAAGAEYNPVRSRMVSIGPEAQRLIVGFRATSTNSVVQSVPGRVRAQSVQNVQAATSASDVTSLVQRVGLAATRSRQLTPSMHVIFLKTTLYGAQVDAALKQLRADSAVKFADVDERRFPHAVPNDPLYVATTGATGQWYMMTPSSLTATSDASATDAVSAWAITTGSTGTVIADIDTGIRFDHPDLLRAGFGGRLLPGYDFVSGDQSSAGASLGTFLAANDGDGWDPDPSDPGDWIDAADQTNSLFASCTTGDSSWHGTRVMGILGALTDNDTGIAGMTWEPYLLPVRALGKCGGFDSDIITGMQWAAGLSVTGVPDNPYPADIVNLSLGGTGQCKSDYADAVTTLTAMGVLVVASAGNESGAVASPANCAGVLAVAGLRNIGTKVGYSSLGAEVGVSAPAGNCVNSGDPCLRSLDTTTNTGLTVPAQNTYTNQSNSNLGTSFSAPIVAGVAALMRAVNANLTPAQLIARIKTSAVAFPQPAGTKLCPDADASTGECACPNDGSQCGAGMVNALNAVNAALRPIAAVATPATSGGSTTLDASGSAAACGRSIAGYAWSTTGGVTIASGAGTDQVTVTSTGTAGTVTLTVTDSANAIDTATLTVTASGVVSAAASTPTSAGSAATACPTALTVAPAAPTVAAAFAPSSVGENVTSTLTLTLSNSNAFDLTQASLTETLPTNLTEPTATTSAATAATTCTGGGVAFSSTASSASLSSAIIPAKGSCTITIPVLSKTAATYTASVAAGALTTGPAGANTAAASATLTVNAPSKSGGGELDGWDTLFAIGVLLAGRRHVKRKT